MMHDPFASIPETAVGSLPGTVVSPPAADAEADSMAEGGVVVVLLLILMVLSLVVAWCVIAFVRAGRRSARAAVAERPVAPETASAWSEAGRRAVPDDDET